MWECLFDKLHVSMLLNRIPFVFLSSFFPQRWNIFFVLLDHLEHFYLTCLWDSQVEGITHMLCACWTGWRASKSLRGKHGFFSSLHKLCIQLQSLRDKDFLDQLCADMLFEHSPYFLACTPLPCRSLFAQGLSPRHEDHSQTNTKQRPNFII